MFVFQSASPVGNGMREKTFRFGCLGPDDLASLPLRFGASRHVHLEFPSSKSPGQTFACHKKKATPAKRYEDFAETGGVARSLQTHPGMRVTRALPTPTNYELSLIVDYDFGHVRLVFGHHRVACSGLESHGRSLPPFSLSRDHL